MHPRSISAMTAIVGLRVNIGKSIEAYPMYLQEAKS